MFAVRNAPGAIKGNYFCDKFVLKKDGLSAQGKSTCHNGIYIYRCIKMIGAVLKLIIFTIMVNRIINTSIMEEYLNKFMTHTYKCSMYAPFVTRHTSSR